MEHRKTIHMDVIPCCRLIPCHAINIFTCAALDTRIAGESSPAEIVTHVERSSFVVSIGKVTNRPYHRNLVGIGGGEVDIGKGTEAECSLSYLLHVGGNGDTVQCQTVVEGFVTYIYKTLRQTDGLQVLTVREGVGTYRNDTLCKGDVFHALTFTECEITNFTVANTGSKIQIL